MMDRQNSGNIATLLSVLFLLASVAFIINTNSPGMTGMAATNDSEQNATTMNNEVLRDVQGNATKGGILEITLLMKDAIINQKVMIEDKIPEGSEILEWNIIGTIEPITEVRYSKQADSATWEFNASRTSPVLSYKLRLPSNINTAYLEATYFLPGGKMSTTKQMLNMGEPLATADSGTQAPPSKEAPKNVIFDVSSYPMATILALGTVILVLITGILLLTVKRQTKDSESSRKDLHLRVHNAMQLQNKDELKARYLSILQDYTSMDESQKHEYFQEINDLYQRILQPK